MLFLLPLTVCVSVRYVERKDYQYMEMVTDSAYMALLAPLHLVVRPDIRSFYKCYGDWFHRPYCEERRVSFVETQMAVYKGGVAWILKECCASSSRTTLAHLACSKLSLKVQKWWDLIQRPTTGGVPPVKNQ